MLWKKTIVSILVCFGEIVIANQLKCSLNLEINQANFAISDSSSLDFIRNSLNASLCLSLNGNITLSSNDPLFLSQNFSLLGNGSSDNLVFQSEFYIKLQNASSMTLSNISISRSSNHSSINLFVLETGTLLIFSNCSFQEKKTNPQLVAAFLANNASLVFEKVTIDGSQAQFQSFFCLENSSALLLNDFSITNSRISGYLLYLHDDSLIKASNFFVINCFFTPNAEFFNQVVFQMGMGSSMENSSFVNLTLDCLTFLTVNTSNSSLFLQNVSFLNISHVSSIPQPLLLNFNDSNISAQINFCIFSQNFAFSSLIYIGNNLGLVSFHNTIFSLNYALNAISCEKSFGLAFWHSGFLFANNDDLRPKNFSILGFGSCILIQNCFYKYFFNFTIQNSISYTDSFGVKIIDDQNEISRLLTRMNLNEILDFNLTITMSHFFNNYIHYQGNLKHIGGVFYLFTFYRVDFYTSIFQFNTLNCSSKTLSRVGGACITVFEGGSLNIQDCIFSRNSAKFQSSGIFFSGNSLSISSSSFTFHSPIIDPSTYDNYIQFRALFHLLSILGFIDGSRGGAIFSSAQETIIENSYFEGNQASYGGSLYLEAAGLSQSNLLSVKSSTFMNEYVGLWGSAIYCSARIHTLKGEIINSTFAGNLAEFSAVYVDLLESLENFLFSFNTFFNNTAEYGAGIFLHHLSGQAFLQNSIFIENKVIELVIKPVSAACFEVWADSRNLLNVSNNVYINNFAGRYGGVFMILGGIAYLSNETIINSTSLMKGGVFILYSQAHLTISDTIIINSTAGNCGGVATLFDISTLLMVNVTIIGGKSLILGGIFEVSENSQFIVRDSLIRLAYSDSGGVLDMFDSIIWKSAFINTTFEDTSGSESDFSITQGNVIFIDCVFNQQSSNLFFIEESSISFQRILIMNSSLNDDFFIFISQNSHVVLSDMIIKNTYGSFQDQLFLLFVDSDVEINKTIILNTFFENSDYVILTENSLVNINNTAFVGFEAGWFQSLNTSFQIINAIFSGESEKFAKGSIFHFLSSTNSSFINSIFNSFVSESNGAALCFAGEFISDSQLFYIESSKFINLHSSQNGGAICIYQSNLEVTNSSFVLNFAAGFGGGIFSQTEFLITFSLLYSNEAQLGGGGIYWRFNIPISFFVFFLNNTAGYGPDQASELIKIAFLLLNSSDSSIAIWDSETSTTSIDNVIREQKSGGDFQFSIKFKYLDWYNQTVTSLTDVIESIDIIDEDDKNELLYSIARKNHTHTYFLGPNNFPVIKGELEVKNIKIISDPNSTVFLKLQSSVLNVSAIKLRKSLQSFEYNAGLSFFIMIPIQIRPCLSGEIFIQAYFLCFECQGDTFSYFPTDEKCSKCLSNANCYGGSKLSVDNGYWRSSNVSLKIYSCQQNSDNCEGGEYSVCLNNFQGPLCRTCLAGFYRIDNNSCIECQSTLWNYLRIAGFILLLFIVVIFLIKSSLDNNQIVTKLKQENIENVSTKALLKHIDLQSLYIKIFVNYLQLLTLLNDLPVELTIPDFINSFFGFLNYFTSLSTKFIGFECIFTSPSLASIKQFTRVICVNLTSIILMGISICFWKFFIAIKKNKEQIMDKIIMTFIGIYLMLQPNILTEFTRVLVCIKLDNSFYIKDEPIYQCEGELYNKMKYIFFWPLFLFWAYFIPFFFLIVLKINQKHLYDFSFYTKMNFFYSGYKEKFYYWDILLFLRKSIVITLAIVSESPLMKIIIGLIVIGIYFNYQVTKNPFATPSLNLLEFCSNLIILSTMYLCIVIFLIDNLAYQFILLIFIFTVNIGYFILWLVLYIKYMRRIYQPFALKIFGLIMKAKNISTKMLTSRVQNQKIRSPQASLKSFNKKSLLNLLSEGNFPMPKQAWTTNEN